MKKFYITTPIYYVNAKPHIGGAYTTIAADVLARWHRMKGEKVFFLTGTDEHGQKIAQAAKKQNTTPQKLCDQNSARFQEVFDTLKISYDRFIRTTDSEHEKMVVQVFKKLRDKKLIYKGTYKGLYCIGCERYYTAKELVNGKCPIHQKKAITLSEECYFFKLADFQQPLLKLIKNNKWVIEPEERRNEVLGFLKSEKLEDLAISREKVAWGIPVPWDNSQTIYVWIDALLNYLSGVGWKGQSKKWPKDWPPTVQLIGKDILRFHAVIWPAILLSLEAPLPKKLYAHGFFTIGGRKMSKSLGNIIDPEEMAMTFRADALRWLLLSIFPFGQDGDISQSKFYDKYNADLSNGLGNLLRRVLTLALKSKKKFSPPSKTSYKFKRKTALIWRAYRESLDQLKFEVALASICDLITFCDRYIDQEEPWNLFRQDVEKYRKVLYNLLESLRHLAWLIQPFMPEKSNQIFECLGLLGQEKKKSLAKGSQWGKTEFKKINQGEVLFPKL
ncbi:methionine--tRNA ligase [Patescibacteria group bacterium]|nr:methionine--tRNA ligase [Patescibacteria group bacterium]